MMGGTATDGSCAMVGGVSRSVPSSPGERSEKFTQEEGSQGCLDGATEIRFQNKSAKERRSLLVRSKDALDVPVPQISVWTHIDSEGVQGVWTGRGPSENDTGVWSSDPDSGAQLSSAIMGRQHSLDHRHPYHAVPSLNTPSPPESANCHTLSPPLSKLSKPNQAASFPKAPSLVVQSSQSTDQQFSSDELRSFSGEKEDVELSHICRCRSSEPLSVSWRDRTSLRSPTSPIREQFPQRNSSPQSPVLSSSNVDLLPSVRAGNQSEHLPSPGSAPWHQAAPAGPSPESDSKNYCKKTLP
jgi:hypothetical protein